MIHIDITRIDLDPDADTGDYEVRMFIPSRRRKGALLYGEYVAEVRGFDRARGWAELVRESARAIEEKHGHQL